MYKDQLTKREQCVNMVKKMARQMNTPTESIRELDHLDFSLLTDEQTDQLHSYLTVLINEVNQAKKQSGIDIFKHIIPLNN